MHIFPIRTEKDHQRALDQVAPFLDKSLADDDPRRLGIPLECLV